MNKAVSILLVCSLFFSTLGKTIIFIHYKFYQQYYTSVLCENKNQPALHCNGKCHLSKELKQQENREKSPFSPIKEKQETIQFFQKYFLLVFELPSTEVQNNFTYLENEPQAVLLTVFRPPAV